MELVAVKDYRLPENRMEFFTKLYAMNLEQGVMPGLVYLYMPALAKRFGWSDENKLWFAFLNGMTQNPITSLIMMKQIPFCPAPGSSHIDAFERWFNHHWANLQFDTDRRYQKVDTVKAIHRYAALVDQYGSQVAMLTGSYKELWKRVEEYVSFGRMSAFSYLEYVQIMGFGADCTDLMFRDKSGSRSHRNGMLLLHGFDNLVWDKRAKNGCTGKYTDFPAMCTQMEDRAQQMLSGYRKVFPDLPNVSNFTLESNLCTFKNHFFARRYPGVYADMAYDRILWAEAHRWSDVAKIFREIRQEHLPEWLLDETSDSSEPPRGKPRAEIFAETGFPYRGECFL